MSLSLALGILVGDVGGYKLLTRAHARDCGGSVNIEDGTVLSGITVRNVTVNGTVLEQAVIAGSVHLADATLVGTNGVIVGGDGGTSVSGVIVGGDGGTSVNGVIVGGDGEINLGGASVSSSGTAVGGTLTGDNITITNGVITGANLLLSGAAISGGSTGGIFTSVSITPAN